jgi:hypothetical protein
MRRSDSEDVVTRPYWSVLQPIGGRPLPSMSGRRGLGCSLGPSMASPRWRCHRPHLAGTYQELGELHTTKVREAETFPIETEIGTMKVMPIMH